MTASGVWILPHKYKWRLSWNYPQHLTGSCSVLALYPGCSLSGLGTTLVLYIELNMETCYIRTQQTPQELEVIKMFVVD